ncbi:MAG: hypothetical protein KDD44_10870, partial [Bdellovibrionales bacterium]|nr:hypothetical protein [Bdellovibrionales bacterium]
MAQTTTTEVNGKTTDKSAASSASQFQALIDRDREHRQKTKWKGTMLEYLDLVKENPQLVELSHARLYRMIVDAGVTEVNTEDDPRSHRIFKNRRVFNYNFFKDFYGMEDTTGAIARYFHSASLKGEESRQVLYLVGPVGSGKSSLIEALKRGLENLTPVYRL